MGQPLILAVPVAAMRSAQMLRDDVDELRCVWMPGKLTAVGRWYQDFSAPRHKELNALLDRQRG